MTVHSRRVLELEGDEVWVLDLALGAERLMQKELLEYAKTKTGDPEDRAKAIAHHQRLLAAAESVDKKLLVVPPEPDAPLPYVVTENGKAAAQAWFASAQEAEKVGQALAKASALEQAIRACLNDPGLVHAFMAAERPELLKRLAEALELDGFDLAQRANQKVA